MIIFGFSFLIFAILCFFYEYNVFYFKNSFSESGLKLGSLYFHFIRYLQGVWFIISVLFHILAFLLFSISFYFYVFYTSCYHNFLLVFLLFYFMFLCAIVPILLLSFFIALDRFYYHFFFRSFFELDSVFCSFFKKIHFLDMFFSFFLCIISFFYIVFFKRSFLYRNFFQNLSVNALYAFLVFSVFFVVIFIGSFFQLMNGVFNNKVLCMSKAKSRALVKKR